MLASFAQNITPMEETKNYSDDKENFVWRAVSLANRHGAFNSADEVVVLHNFEIGRTYIDSRWMKEIGYDPDKKQNSLH